MSYLWGSFKRMLGVGGKKRHRRPGHLRTDHFGDPTRNYNQVNRRPYSYSNGHLVETVGEDQEGDTRELDDTVHNDRQRQQQRQHPQDLDTIMIDEEELKAQIAAAMKKKSNKSKQNDIKFDKRYIAALPINDDPFLHPYDQPNRMKTVLEPIQPGTIVLG